MVILASRQATGSIVPAKYQYAYDEVVARVRDGRWPPGHKLPTIRDLAAELGVGQSTLKIALTLLGRDGWTRGQQGDGTYVADTPPIG